jgi:hypothetical protein
MTHELTVSSRSRTAEPSSSLIVAGSSARNALGKIDKVSIRAAHAAPAGARVGQREDGDEKS